MSEPTQNGFGDMPEDGSGAGSAMPPIRGEIELSNDDRLWALLAHLSIFVFAPISCLVVWLVKKEDSPFVADQTKEALNFQLTVLIAELVLAVTCIGPIIIAIAAIIYAILAAMEANKGNYYRYPYTWRLIK